MIEICVSVRHKGSRCEKEFAYSGQNHVCMCVCVTDWQETDETGTNRGFEYQIKRVYFHNILQMIGSCQRTLNKGI